MCALGGLFSSIRRDRTSTDARGRRRGPSPCGEGARRDSSRGAREGRQRARAGARLQQRVALLLPALLHEAAAVARDRLAQVLHCGRRVQHRVQQRLGRAAALQRSLRRGRWQGCIGPNPALVKLRGRPPSRRRRARQLYRPLECGVPDSGVMRLGYIESKLAASALARTCATMQPSTVLQLRDTAEGRQHAGGGGGPRARRAPAGCG